MVASLLSSAGPCPPTSDLWGSNRCCFWPLQNPESRLLLHLSGAASCVVAEIFSPSLRSRGAGHDGDGVWQFWPIWRFLWGRELCPPSSSWKIWSDWKKTWNSFKLFHFAYELVKSTKTILDWLAFRSSWWNLSDIPLIFKEKLLFCCCLWIFPQFAESVWSTRRTANANANLTSSACLSAHTNTSHHTHQCSDGVSAGACWVATAERGRSAAGPAVSPLSPHPEWNLLAQTPSSGGSGQGLQPFARPPLMSSEDLRARWRKADLWGGGVGGYTAAQITSDINPQNKVGLDPHGEQRGTTGWPRKAEPSALVNFIHAFIPSDHWETRVKGHQKLLLKPKV